MGSRGEGVYGAYWAGHFLGYGRSAAVGPCRNHPHLLVCPYTLFRKFRTHLFGYAG